MRMLLAPWRIVETWFTRIAENRKPVTGALYVDLDFYPNTPAITGFVNLMVIRLSRPLAAAWRKSATTDGSVG